MISLLAALTPFALGVAASPLPVVAVLVILVSKRARPGSVVLAVCWIVGNSIAVGIAITFAGSIRRPQAGLDLWWEAFFTLLLGIGLIVAGVLARRGRHHTPGGGEPPTWVNSVDQLSPLGAGLVALSNATTSPKNLALAISAGNIVARSEVDAPYMGFAALWYVFVASLTVVVPVVLYFVGGEKSVVVLRRWRDAVTANAAAVMEITLFVLGIGMSAKGLYNLLS